MDFKSLLTNIPSGAEKELLIREVLNSDQKFRILLDYTFQEKDPLAWRAAWVLDGCDEQSPGLVAEFIPDIIYKLPEMKSSGTLRCLLRLLCRYDIDEEDQGVLIDLCFKYLVSELYPVAVKVHAMQIIYQHVLIYPELKGELTTVILDQIDNNTVGFKSRGKRLIRDMKKMKL